MIHRAVFFLVTTARQIFGRSSLSATRTDVSATAKLMSVTTSQTSAAPSSDGKPRGGLVADPCVRVHCA
jgi:hypothetical protein